MLYFVLTGSAGTQEIEFSGIETFVSNERRQKNGRAFLPPPRCEGGKYNIGFLLAMMYKEKGVKFILYSFLHKLRLSKEIMGNFFLVVFFAVLIILGLTFGFQNFYTSVLLRQISLTETESVMLIENDYQSMSHNLTNASYQLANDETVSQVFSRRNGGLTLVQLQKLTKILSQHVRAIPYVDSIYLLNQEGKSVYYSTNSLTQAVEFNNEDLSDQQIFKYLQNFGSYRYQFPVNRSTTASTEIFGSSTSENFLTYIYSPQPISTKNIKHAVVINVSVTELGRRLKELSPAAITLIFDRDKVIASSDPAIFAVDDLVQDVVDESAGLDEKRGSCITEIGGKKYLCVYRQIDDTLQWCVKLVPYDHITSQIAAAQQGIVAICVIVLGIALLLSAAVSIHVNAPVLRLQRQYDILQQNEAWHSEFLRREYVRHLLTDKNFATSELYTKKVCDIPFNVDFSLPCMILNFTFDVRDLETKSFYEKDKRVNETLYFAIERQLSRFECEICTISAWKYVAILQRPEQGGEIGRRVADCCAEIQYAISHELPFDVSVAAAEFLPASNTLAYAYEHTKALLNYRISFGCGEFLTDEKMEKIISTEYESFYKKKQELIRRMLPPTEFNLQEVKKSYHELIETILYFCYEDFTSCIIDLALDLTGILENHTRKHRTQLQVADFNGMIRQAETIHQVDRAFYFLFSLMRTLSTPRDKKAAAKMAEVKNYIADHYMEQTLSVNSLAEHYKMSPSYLGQLFSTHHRSTITNYISAIRIEHSKTLLKNSTLSIAEIAKRTGFSSHKYFCKVFKETTRSTPKEYRQQISDEFRAN